MAIVVEFFGTVRSRAETADTVLTSIDGKLRLGEAIAVLSGRFPRLCGHCLIGNRLAEGFAASVDGKIFVTEPEDLIFDGQTLLLMSSDAGG